MAIDLAVFLIAFGIAYWVAPPASVPPLQERNPALFWTDVVNLAVHNICAAVVLVVATACSAGVLGVVLFAGNGYVFGATLGVLPAGSPVELVLLYSPIELLALLVAAMAGHRLAATGVGWLEGNEVHWPWRAVVVQFAVAAGALCVAAVLESWAIQLRSGR